MDEKEKKVKIELRRQSYPELLNNNASRRKNALSSAKNKHPLANENCENAWVVESNGNSNSNSSNSNSNSNITGAGEPLHLINKDIAMLIAHRLELNENELRLTANLLYKFAQLKLNKELEWQHEMVVEEVQEEVKKALEVMKRAAEVTMFNTKLKMALEVMKEVENARTMERELKGVTEEDITQARATLLRQEEFKDKPTRKEFFDAKEIVILSRNENYGDYNKLLEIVRGKIYRRFDDRPVEMVVSELVDTLKRLARLSGRDAHTLLMTIVQYNRRITIRTKHNEVRQSILEQLESRQQKFISGSFLVPAADLNMIRDEIKVIKQILTYDNDISMKTFAKSTTNKRKRHSHRRKTRR